MTARMVERPTAEAAALCPLIDPAACATAIDSRPPPFAGTPPLSTVRIEAPVYSNVTRAVSATCPRPSPSRLGGRNDALRSRSSADRTSSERQVDLVYARLVRSCACRQQVTRTLHCPKPRLPYQPVRDNAPSAAL